MRQLATILLLSTLPLVPTACVIAAAHAQPVPTTSGELDLVTSWATSILTTLGTPAALVGALYLAARWMWRLVTTGAPIDLTLRLDDRVLQVTLAKHENLPPVDRPDHTES